MIRFKTNNYRVSSSAKEPPVINKSVDRNRINLNIVLHGQDDPEFSTAADGESLVGIGVIDIYLVSSSHP